MKIAVTKLEEKSQGIRTLFARYGHEAIVVSTMKTSGPADVMPLLHLCDMISKDKIDILIFTSALGVEKLFEKVKPGRNVRIVSVGPKTAKKVEEYGISSEVIDSFSSENFARFLGDITGKSIGIARADVPNPELITSLASGGATIVEAPAYGLRPVGWDILDKLKDADAVIFTSAMSFESSGFGMEHAKMLKIAAIGQKTAEAMRKRGIVPDIVGNGTLESCLALLS
jgi:uroporphyrinogen-III synthase